MKIGDRVIVNSSPGCVEIGTIIRFDGSRVYVEIDGQKYNDSFYTSQLKLYTGPNFLIGDRVCYYRDHKHLFIIKGFDWKTKTALMSDGNYISLNYPHQA